ncbi:MAG: sigma-70 family RNA polymerase sigma factor [Rhodothermaceae bacterium]|nr:sigma-70 family RNA polymerase sigma factor [Rhodothermaceae bacterium]
MESFLDDDFSEFMEAFDETLQRFVRSQVSTDQAAQDIVQDVWFGFFRSLDRGSIIEDPEAWLYRSARNRVIDAYRKIKPVDVTEMEFEAFEDAESPEDDLHQKEFFDLLEAALDELPDNQRLVFMRNEIEGVTLREIAEEENEKLKTIISRKRYAVTRIRAALGDYYDEFLGE